MAFNQDAIGRDELLKRAVLAAAPYSERGLVYAGFSLGAATAQTLALGDEKARGLLLLHGTSDIADDRVRGRPARPAARRRARTPSSRTTG